VLKCLQLFYPCAVPDKGTLCASLASALSRSPAKAWAHRGGAGMSGLRAWVSKALEVGRVDKGIAWVRFFFDGNRW
jgi:hypothetical protein